MSDARIFIAIPLFNRRAVVEQCVPTVRVSPDDTVILYDDGSTEYDSGFWETMNPHVTGLQMAVDSIGIDAQRKNHFKDFWARRDEFTHLYLCDSDAPHDPNWRTHALDLQARYSAPICLYRTRTHADYDNNIFADLPSEDVIWQRFSPGVSLLLTTAHVERIMAHLPEGPWAWDWAVPGLLGYRMAVSRVSHVDHIGWHGLHDRNVEPRKVSTERCLMPTEGLKQKRGEVMGELKLNDC